MIDHVSIGVRSIAAVRPFYDAALRPLGYRCVMEFAGVAGYGSGRPEFWIGERRAGEEPAVSGAGLHVAFSAPDRGAVDAFHAAALAHGGRDNGAPGLRPHYHPDYYAAFVVDPDGNRIEAVCHAPVSS